MTPHITVGDRMTLSPHSIGRDQTLDTAHALLRKHGIRHLPVLSGGTLVGVLSPRDLHLVETLPDVDPAHVRVDEAMSQDVYAVGPRTPLRDVVDEMSERKLGSAIVMEDERVVGVFTTIDALDTLSELLRVGA
jgi:acetoin utilization protein AcuB